MFREFIGILGEAATDMIDAYNEIDNERAELVEAIRKYNSRAALYGKKPLVLMEEKPSANAENDTEKLKKYFSEKLYSGQYKAEADLNGFGFRRVSGSTWKKGNCIASIEYDRKQYNYTIKLF